MAEARTPSAVASSYQTLAGIQPASLCTPLAASAASPPTGPVTAVVDLERAPSGAPDGGRPGGHRGGGLEATTEGSMLAFPGRVRPPVAQLVVRGARASVTVSPSGAFLVWLR